MKEQIFEHTSNKGHEQIVFCRDDASGLKAIIAIHNTNLGPALGGCRVWNYASEAEALNDALRLSQGMTYKAAVAGLDLGGGKAVIIADTKNIQNRKDLFQAFAEFVHSLSGKYITAEDVGTTVADMDWVRTHTPHVVGISPQFGGSGDPSLLTAIGVQYGMKACVNKVFGTDSLQGKRILLQGLGHVGYPLLKALIEEGAEVFVTDIDSARVEAVKNELGVETVSPNDIFDLEADIFCPCALGAIINDNTIDRLKVQIIAGSANNQLADYSKHGQMLLDKGIIYAPDYVINGGGLINVSHEIKGYNKENALKDCKNIFNTITEVLSMSEKEKIPTMDAANKMAEKRIHSKKKTKHSKK